MNKLQLYYRKLIKRTPSPDKWVFIVGCYNSGTTLLHDILAKHPAVGSMEFEGQYMTDQLPIKHNNLERLWAISPEIFCLNENSKTNINSTKIKENWGVHINHPKRPVLIEKSPTNSARMRWLQKEFENAHFIAIVRNGYAVSEGINRKVKHDIALCAEQWNISNKIMLSDLGFIKNKLLITYEDLTQNPESEFNKITNFIGIEALSNDVFNQKIKIRKDHSQIKNMNEKSFNNLSDSDKKMIYGKASETLNLFNYTTNLK